MRLATQLVTAILMLILAACTQAPTPTPLPPLTTDNVRERVVDALQRDGRVMQFRVELRDVDGDVDGVQLGWLDLANRRAHLKDGRGRGAAPTLVFTEGRQAVSTGNLGGSGLFELPLLSLAATPWVALPPSVDNPALLALGPLGAALASGKAWTAAGAGEWEGTPATVWEVDYPGPELPMHTYVRIYLDAALEWPLAEVLEFAPEEEEEREPGLTATYVFEFIEPNDVPQRAFDIEELRERAFRYGDHSSTPPGFPVWWLGKSVEIGGGFPTLSLMRSGLTGPRRDSAEFHYQVVSRVPLQASERFGMVEVAVRPLTEDEWSPPVDAEPITLAGMVGHRVLASGPTTTATVWLPGVIVSIEAPALTSVPPPESYAPGAEPPPDDGTDRNEFNNEQALRALVEHLEVLR